MANLEKDNPGGGAVCGAARLLSVNHYSGSPELIAGGPEGFATAFAIDVPEEICSAATLSLRVGDTEARVRYIGPPHAEGLRQFNFQISADAPIGQQAVTLCSGGVPVSNSLSAVVRLSPARTPRFITVTDAVEIMSVNRILGPLIQLTLDGCDTTEGLEVTIGGHELECVRSHCEDSLSKRHKVNMLAPDELRGLNMLRVSLKGILLYEGEVDLVRKADFGGAGRDRTAG